MNNKKLLIITRNSWNTASNTGSTTSNFFGDWSQENIANIYCRYEKIHNDVCTKYYRITEQDLIGNLLKKIPAGAIVEYNNLKEEESDNSNVNKTKMHKIFYSILARHRLTIFLWVRELLWLTNKWKTIEFIRFLSDFNPDIIYMPAYDSPYMHRLLWWIAEKTNARVILFHSDDYLTTKCTGFAILAKINSYIRSHIIAKSAKKADINYCITEKQMTEYSNKLGIEMKLLYKGANFFNQPNYFINSSPKKIRLVYVGSILYGRWRTLSNLARTIQIINMRYPIFELLIYSQNQPTKIVEKQIVIKGSSKFMGKIPSEKVAEVLRDADIVLHIESLDRKERLATRLSFSTKIVDCLHSGRCVMAIGWEKAASIDYLIRHDAALVATNEAEISSQLNRILDNPLLLKDYADKAWKCGEKNHQIEDIRDRLNKDIELLVKGRLK